MPSYFGTRRIGEACGSIGTVLRKVLLSTSAGKSPLPEGYPEQKVIEQVTEGAMDGFFVAGSSLAITDAVKSDVNFNIDLNKCFFGNRREWENIFEGVWGTIARFAILPEQHGLAPATAGLNQPVGDPTGELMVALMGLPVAMRRCGISLLHQKMLMEAIQTMGSLHFKFRFPNDRIPVSDVSNKLAKAVDDWTNQRFRKFGTHLGGLMREMIFMTINPQLIGKYSVDEHGILQRTMDDLEENKPWALSVSTMYGGLAMVFLMILLVARVFRPSSTRASFSDISRQHLNTEAEDEDVEAVAVE